jgi:perosamine synthetase
MDPILALAERHGLAVIEDAAEAHGAEYKGRRCGGIGHISTFSFYANKLVTTGEGGMVLVRTAELARQARSLRNLCLEPARRFRHEALGHNFRLTNVQAAVGVGQIARIRETIARKREIARIYREALSDVPAIRLPAEMPWANNVYWVYGILLESGRGIEAEAVMRTLAARGVEARPFFWCMHEQPVFRRMGLFRGDRHPVAEHLARCGFYIPNGLSLTPVEQEQVIAAVREVLA